MIDSLFYEKEKIDVLIREHFKDSATCTDFDASTIIFSRISYDAKQENWLIKGIEFSGVEKTKDLWKPKNTMCFTATMMIPDLPKECTFYGTTMIDGKEYCLFNEKGRRESFEESLSEDILRFVTESPMDKFSMQGLKQLYKDSPIYDRLFDDSIEILAESGEVFFPEKGCVCVLY